ncbi:polysaccharide deacetylase family protein [Hominifimenecus sp. rT4P-3]|uniref:polysaccharide deacetylase family protein n=1 Tax=Hominifimenecus sp. rT4P-3 TaxID=3242979 RepID=UPI003DA30BCA
MEDYRGRMRDTRRRARRRRAIRNRIILTVLLLILVVAAVILGKKFLDGDFKKKENTTFPAGTTNQTETAGEPGESTPAESGGAPAADADSALSQAAALAASYDYDGAIALLKSVSGYESDSRITEVITGYEETKKSLVAADITQIPHVFFHSLIVDTAKAFGSEKSAAYNQVMTTVDEFDAIMQQMYEKGYVLVKIHDMASKQDGEMKKGTILLPPGKKPFVLSVDDVSYYEYMQGHGFANRIVIGEDGYPTCEMDMANGTVQTGAFDVVPRLEEFIKAHPDFSYKGARGIIALTGYDGILGYRTAPKYGDPSDDSYKAEYASINVESEREKAKSVAARMEELGWEFASHSWGHKDMGQAKIENMKTDMQKWLDQVNPLLGGDTDILIFPKGTDIGSWRGYDNNEKYDYLSSVGFDYYCNVDGNQPWVQCTSKYLRQGRINADGFEMYYHADKLSPFFDAASVFDKARPTPVKPMG